MLRPVVLCGRQNVSAANESFNLYEAPVDTTSSALHHVKPQSTQLHRDLSSSQGHFIKLFFLEKDRSHVRQDSRTGTIEIPENASHPRQACMQLRTGGMWMICCRGRCASPWRCSARHTTSGTCWTPTSQTTWSPGRFASPVPCIVLWLHT
jgi:hypothetical protein